MQHMSSFHTAKRNISGGEKNVFDFVFFSLLINTFSTDEIV